MDDCILPVEIIQLILDMLPLPTQVNLTQLNHYIQDHLRITDFYNIEQKYQQKITDDILKKYPYIKKLDASNNLKITNEGLKHLNLHTLNVSLDFSYYGYGDITEDGIKHMPLINFKAHNYRNLIGFWLEHRDNQIKDMKSTDSFITKEQLIDQEKKYQIHWNCGRPFEVIVKNKEIHVYNNLDNQEILHIKDFIGFWYGYDSAIREDHGNTILVQISKHKYITIQGHDKTIRSFETNDEILDYVSPIGNNDVPYPVAFGEENVYFMLDEVYIPINELKKEISIRNAEQLYADFYDYEGNKNKWKHIVELKNLE
ncbi:hypothetical protein Klosneuvirus_1_114 [Klosneuvirus KNV1]|uniref:Uncharacterized protein n=1 Tax=Klosneuvirus KNV1 TaxID=1977640 RepID=A0A1V0SHR3_9VIRU|nr:hypothetical protein Klosneuvirus_1_114 [Klosneuvirus KNV1]